MSRPAGIGVVGAAKKIRNAEDNKLPSAAPGVPAAEVVAATEAVVPRDVREMRL